MMLPINTFDIMTIFPADVKSANTQHLEHNSSILSENNKSVIPYRPKRICRRIKNLFQVLDSRSFENAIFGIQRIKKCVGIDVKKEFQYSILSPTTAY